MLDSHVTRENFTAWLMTHLSDLYHLAENQDGCAIRSRLQSIVSEYTPGDTDCIL